MRSFATQYMPAKPMWLNETAEAACGGDRAGGAVCGYVSVP